MAETRARRQIREAVEAAGGEVDFIEWEPIGANVEMQGRSGGWTVFLKPDGHIVGRNVDDVLDWIERCGVDG